MKINEKIRNEETLSNALTVSIKCGLRKINVVKVLQDEHYVYIWVKNLSHTIKNQFHVNYKG